MCIRDRYKGDPLIREELNPIAKVSQEFLASIESSSFRKLPKEPYKVLDAPGLRNDFYLNIVDWSSTDILAVALSHALYVLKENLTQVELILEIPPGNEITALSFSPNGSHLFLGYTSGAVQVVDTEASKVVASYTGHSSVVTCGSWLNDSLFSTGADDKLILDRDVRTPTPFVKFHEGHKQKVCNLKWSLDGRFLASGGCDNKALVWDLHHVSPLLTLSGHTAAVKGLAWNPLSGNLLATGGGTDDRSIKIWDCVDNKCLKSTDTGSQVCCMEFSKRGHELITTHGYMNNAISLWNPYSLAKLGAIAGNSGRVLHLAISPDGETVATGAEDETLKFWKMFPSGKKGKECVSSLILSCMELR
eukprot:TRINITY_DN12837_c0_g1_i7.p1 TRINITY_DN12837_c0_g1~~TRINITY_DN12837_c0_g1_i7.p1  ORF type:complete len:362 (+),score=41.56 TRINITY_DN12837_c0_g1_i7:109-1194(+)